MKYHKQMLDVVFYARGGQGGKSAAEIMAQAAFSEGKYVQAFPQFGPERSGAPTKTFIRVSNEPIRTHEPVVDPDVVVVLDETIIESEKVSENLDQNEFLIVNSRASAQEIKDRTGYNGKVFPIDANGISMEIIGQARPNTVILGKLVQVAEIASLSSVKREFRKIFESKLGKTATDKNIAAIEKAYDTI
jgi:pyruvate ferredoxin oxidoreductase gamma subunit